MPRWLKEEHNQRNFPIATLEADTLEARHKGA